MELRLVRAALARKRGPVALAVIAVAIGASVASALLHVSGDVSRKLSHELQSLGPNVLVVPRESVPAGTRTGAPSIERSPATHFFEGLTTRMRLARAGIDGVPLLYVVARVNGRPIQVIGSDIGGSHRLHPGWNVTRDPRLRPTDMTDLGMIGTRLMHRLNLGPGRTVTLEFANGEKHSVAILSSLESGTADDEALWIAIDRAQDWSGLADKVSLFQARIESGRQAADALERRFSSDPSLRVIQLRALSATEAGLLDRMRGLMFLVTLAALAAAGLAAFGTLTDLALERRRDIALMKALGARRRDIVRQFAAEALVIGLVGGILGWLFGVAMAEVIGREVFRASIALRADVPLIVLGLSLLVAGIASLGPIRLALSVEPAAALKGE